VTEPLPEIIERAVELAAEWHEGTYRKSRWRQAPFEPPPEVVLQVPVMAHVTAVALAVQRTGWPDHVVAAAFLHDVLEDRNRFGDAMPRDMLVAEVGEEVAALVEVVSEPRRDAAGRPLPWRMRKDSYLAQLQRGPAEATAISLADKIHNAWTMNESLAAGVDIFEDAPGRRALSEGPAAQLWFFRSVLGATDRPDPRMAALRIQLEQQVARFEQLIGALAHGGDPTR
jgi:(p)ppGpp synthase/HD superfamily hydrolase